MILGNPSDSKAETKSCFEKCDSRLEFEQLFIWSCLAGQDSLVSGALSLPGTHHTPTYVGRLLTKAEEGTAGDPDRTG